MSGGVSATLINDGIVGEQSGKSAVRAESAGGELGTGWHNQGQWIRNKATLPALAGREGLFRVNTTPYGNHMALPSHAVHLRCGWAGDFCTARGLFGLSSPAEWLGWVLALDARRARVRAAHLDSARPV